ncbi:MAG: PDZ domain-containing protein [Synechococcales cyanobacterium RM1_1_8]|nr:PDZ domain-containing protein [Synechococcales cyanobacterium RM1_1_8]
MKLFKSFAPAQAALFAGAIATTFSLSLIAPGSSVRAAWQDSPKAVVDQAWQIVNREYVDPSFNQQDWQEVRSELLRADYGDREDAYEALRTALKTLEDPYTRFMDQKQYESLTDQTSGELSGVGMRLTEDEKTKVLTVASPIKNSPAMAAGVKAGDQILKIDGVSTKGMTVEEAAEKIRGQEGSQVELEFSREGKSIVRKLTRARVEIPSIEFSIRQEGPERVGYIRLSQFTSHAAEEMQAAIKELNSEGADAFVLDLRGNPGGLLYAAIDISRMWIQEGDIVKTVDRDEKDDKIKANNTALTDLPLAVLVDKGSASSSEILSGALQDNGRATIVGTTTFGKALVQSLHPLADGSGIAVTIAHYYTPKGTDISKKGIKPDVEVSLSEQEQERLANNPEAIATMEDPQYAKAIELLRKAN